MAGKLEEIKAGSNQLRGDLAGEIAADSTHFSEQDKQVLKFHGIYQQDDRDRRLINRRAGREKAYSFMLRTRLPGGKLTAEQYLVHDDLATRFANNTLRITTRQCFQFHGILKGDIKATLQSLNEELVTSLGACGDVVRNVMACPAPIDDPVRRAVSATTVALSAHLLPRTRAYHEVWLEGERVYSGLDGAQEEPIYGKTYLPRKFKIAIAYPGDNCVDVYTQDIGLVAIVEQSAAGERLRGYNVLVGGGMGMHHTKPDTFPRLGDLLGFITPEQVVDVVEQIVLIQRDYGNRVDRKQARMKYLINNWGVSRFRIELETRLGYTLQAPAPMPAMENNLHLGWHPQGDGNWFLGLSVENGRVQDTAERQLKRGLRAVVDQFRPGVRLTANHDILLTDVTPADREQIDSLLGQFGIRQSQEISLVERYAMACPAMPTCGLALAESERALPAIIDALEQEVAALGLEHERITIRMTGCPNGCARPYVADIGFVGRSKDQYTVFLGGRNDGTRLNQVYADLVAGGDLVATIRPLLVYFKAARRPGERFGDFCSRIGMHTLAKIAHAQYQQRSENDDHARIAA